MKLVFDLEADGWRDEATRVWCLVAVRADVPQMPKQFGPEHIEDALKYLDEADELIGHNILNYDLPVLERLYGWTPKPGTILTDTVVLSRLLKSDRRLPKGCPGSMGTHSLGAWGYRLGRGKPDHDDWTQYSEEMLHRCTEDAQINVGVYRALVREARDTGVDWRDSRNTEHRIAEIITQQETNGVPFDIDAAYNLKAELEVGIRDIDEELVPSIPEVPLPKSKQPTWPKKQFKKDGSPTAQALRYYGDGHDRYRTDIIVKTAPINLGSDKQVKEYLLSIGWRPTEWNYKKDPKTGKPLRDMVGNKIRTSPKLTEDSMESLEEGLGKKIALRLKMAHRLSLVTGLIDNVRPDGKLTASAIPQGTPTGRMTHRVVVNIPGSEAYLGHELRDLFTTEEGYTRVGIDLKNCQLRGLCHYMEDPEYQRAVLEGTKENDDDSHCLARDLAGLDTRQQGKKFTYSILFGASNEKLAADLGISVVEAEHARKRFFANLVKLDELMKRLEKEWKTLGYLKGLDGRAIWVRAKHMLLVYLLQDLEACVMKNFIIRLCDHASGHKVDYKLVTTMHDEVQFLVRTEEVSTFKMYAQTAIKEVNAKFNLKCPQEIDIELGRTWADCH